jgi:hypothetical protein
VMGHGAVWPLGQQCLLPVPGNCEFRDGDTKQKGRPGDDGARRAGEQYPGRDACGEDMTWLTNDALRRRVAQCLHHPLCMAGFCFRDSWARKSTWASHALGLRSFP